MESKKVKRTPAQKRLAIQKIIAKVHVKYFGQPRVAGASTKERFFAFLFRVFGCDHPTNMVCDLGDEDHEYWFCFKCFRKLS